MEELTNTYKQKYNRQHLKPIVRSVYNKRSTIRVNGSLHGALKSSGLNTLEVDAKILAHSPQQNLMT